ncbi:MAG: hypothetical protein ACOZQL_43680 [Myxococcota bacterium]
MTARLAVLLGLAIQFSKNELLHFVLHQPRFCFPLQRGVLLIYLFLRRSQPLFLLSGNFDSALLARFRGDRFGGEGGSFYIRCLKVVKVFVLSSGAPMRHGVETDPFVLGRFSGSSCVRGNSLGTLIR